MSTYYFLLSLLVLLVNFGYAFARLGVGNRPLFSAPLIIGSLVVAVVCLRLIRRKLARIPTEGRR